MKTGIIYSKKSLNHDTGDGHPENKFRIQSILERLKVTFTMEPVSPRPPIVKSKISAFLFFESSIQPLVL